MKPPMYVKLIETRTASASCTGRARSSATGNTGSQRAALRGEQPDDGERRDDERAHARAA